MWRSHTHDPKGKITGTKPLQKWAVLHSAALVREFRWIRIRKLDSDHPLHMEVSIQGGTPGHHPSSEILGYPPWLWKAPSVRCESPRNIRPTGLKKHRLFRPQGVNRWIHLAGEPIHWRFLTHFLVTLGWNIPTNANRGVQMGVFIVHHGYIYTVSKKKNISGLHPQWKMEIIEIIMLTPLLISFDPTDTYLLKGPQEFSLKYTMVFPQRHPVGFPTWTLKTNPVDVGSIGCRPSIFQERPHWTWPFREI